MQHIIDLVTWIRDILRDPGIAIQWGGYPGLALIIFLETGALVFFLPGDSLLVVAGLYAAKGDLNIGLLQLLVLPAIIGDATSYLIGYKTGPAIFSKKRSRLFRPEYLELARLFYEKHGGKAIIIARFMPIVRTFVPVVAGVAQMSYRRFAMYNIVGALLWITSMTLIGYLLGAIFGEKIGKYIEYLIVLVVFLSISPGLFQWVKSRRKKKAKSDEPPRDAEEEKRAES